MALFITMEVMLFVMLFIAYYYTKKGNDRWHNTEPPALHYSLPMLGILAISSGVLYWGEESVKKGEYTKAKLGLIGTIGLGIVFLVLTYYEYKEHLAHVTPRTNAYGTTFYTITSLHGIHLVFGLFMLSWVLIMPRWEPALLTPHRPYHNAAMYWHFVDTMWLFIVILLYVIPNIYNTI
jgi:heme/copper-type cytochrome/quinol oxidase subunit 3